MNAGPRDCPGRSKELQASAATQQPAGQWTGEIEEIQRNITRGLSDLATGPEPVNAKTARRDT